MFGWLRRRAAVKAQAQAAHEAGRNAAVAAHEAGSNAGARMVAEVERYLAQRTAQLHSNVLGVLRERLATIYDDLEHEPKIVARVELSIFIDNIKGYKDRVRQDAVQDLAAWLNLARDSASETGLMTLIDIQISNAYIELLTEGAVLVSETIKELNEKS